MGGKIFFGVLIVVAMLAIAGLLYRPATVIGVSDKSLAYSLRGEAKVVRTGSCRGANDRFVCTALSGDSSTIPVPYAITVDDYGCWDGKRRGGGSSDLPQTLEGCITIVDLVRIDD